MLVHRLQRRPTLTQRVLAVFVSQPGQRLHYTALAQILHHRTPVKVGKACWCLWCQGRLTRYGEGLYGLPEETE